MSTEDEAWMRFFQGAYQRIYHPLLSEEHTQREVEGMIHLLNVPRGGMILDVGCGTGRHAIRLAEKGYRVTGLDHSEHLLALAQQEASSRQVQVQWILRDMRAISFCAEFDGVINIFSSFGYFNDTDNLHVLQAMQHALKPGGLLLLDILPQSRTLRTWRPTVIQRYDDGLLVLEERHFDVVTSRYHVHETLLFPEGVRQEYKHSLRLYTVTEMLQLLERAHLSVRQWYGSLTHEPLSCESRLIVLAQRTM